MVADDMSFVPRVSGAKGAIQVILVVERREAGFL